MRDRICYFSKTDLSVGYYLEIAEKRIQEVSEGNVPTDLEGIIELWHIKCMFENDCRLRKWTDEEFKKLKSSTIGYNAIVANYFNGLNPKMIKSQLEEIEWTYKKTFWEIIDACKLYKLIEPEILREILSENNDHLREVLECKGVVEKFKGVIREILTSNVNSAHIILDRYVAKQDGTDNEIYLPSNLTLADKEQIIIGYLQSDNPNLNYVRLITQVRDDKTKVVLSPRTRLWAEQLSQKLNDELMNDPRTVKTHWSFGVQFDDNTVKPVEISINEQETETYIYSIPFIKSCDNTSRIINCVFLFGWMNEHFLINLISKHVEISELESTFMDSGRDAYPTFKRFYKKNVLAFQQLYAYNVVLRDLGDSFEKELKQFYEIYLRKEYDYPGMSINFPLEEDSALNKCRVLCPELDAIVKQYNIFVEEDEINKDLLRLSKPLKVEEGKSLLTNKYFEIAEDNEDIRNVLRLLFGSGISLLHFVAPFKNKHYHSLIELLENEKDVLYSNYEDYQKPCLDALVKQGIIGISADGGICIENQTKIDVLKSLWEYGACSYWHYNEEGRQILDEMLNKGWLITNDHLLSKPEQDYFSYYLDNMKFTNGKAYRNNYAHGSTPPVDDEEAHINAYYTFLRLLALLLLKIEDDLWLARKAMAIFAINERKSSGATEWKPPKSNRTRMILAFPLLLNETQRPFKLG